MSIGNMECGTLKRQCLVSFEYTSYPRLRISTCSRLVCALSMLVSVSSLQHIFRHSPVTSSTSECACWSRIVASDRAIKSSCIRLRSVTFDSRPWHASDITVTSLSYCASLERTRNLEKFSKSQCPSIFHTQHKITGISKDPDQRPRPNLVVVLQPPTHGASAANDEYIHIYVYMYIHVYCSVQPP